MQKHSEKESLIRTWQWFCKSGVMNPADGSWGVAERIMLTEGNSAAGTTLEAFPAWTPKHGHCIIEQRRADCCMETAFLFILLHRIFGEKAPFRKTAENILEFLYYRSGLLNRNCDRLNGAWDWSHIRRFHSIYFDDNSWMIFLALKIARMYPSLDRKYRMKDFALKLADTMSEDAPVYLAGKEKPAAENDFAWSGRILQPHFGSLVCMALSEAFKVKKNPLYRKFVNAYEKHLMDAADSFTTSENCYALIGCTCSARAEISEDSLSHARFFAEKILSKMDPKTGNIPSEHNETPAGKGLCDTIYTMNWAALGMQNMMHLDPEYAVRYEKIAALLLKIQDRAREKHLSGCWRGLYDIESGKWGGGNCFEGGADSIYTGWTNAPIAWSFALDLLKSSLMDI